MKDLLGRLFYRFYDAIGTLSIYFIITEGFYWKYAVALVIAGVMQALSPYRLTGEVK